MSCCSVPCRDTNRFFSRLARLSRWRFRVFGFEHSQRQLIDGLVKAGVAGASLIEVGCGVGHLHRHLLDLGAGSAVGVDISTAMLDEARDLSQRAGYAQITDYRAGDFVDLAPEVARCDILIMDKVVCCYPDPEGLIEAGLSRTTRLVGLTYPRDRRMTRLAMGLIALWQRALGSDFRTYVHDPGQIRAWITGRGYDLCVQSLTTGWITEIYSRQGEPITR